jgi:hypothetical protein
MALCLIFSDDDLDLIADAEGATGFIIDLTMKIQPKEELEVVAIGCSDAQSYGYTDAAHDRLSDGQNKMNCNRRIKLEVRI